MARWLRTVSDRSANALVNDGQMKQVIAILSKAKSHATGRCVIVAKRGRADRASASDETAAVAFFEPVAKLFGSIDTSPRVQRC